MVTVLLSALNSKDFNVGPFDHSDLVRYGGITNKTAIRYLERAQKLGTVKEGRGSEDIRYRYHHYRFTPDAQEILVTQKKKK